MNRLERTKFERQRLGALIFGVSVATASVLPLAAASPLAPHPGVLQDPKEAEQIVPKDFPAFLKLLDEATELRLERTETVGAGSITRADGTPADRLDTVPWRQMHRVLGTDLKLWRDAFRASRMLDKGSNTINDAYNVVLTLPGDRVVRCFANWDQTNAEIWVGGDKPLCSGEELAKLFRSAHSGVTEAHRLARGEITTPKQWLAMAANGERLDVAVELLATVGEAPAAATIRRLCLRGEPDERAWALAASLPQLRELELVGATMDGAVLEQLTQRTDLTELVLRGCQGLSQTAALRLRSLRRLERLWCIDTNLGGSDLDLSVLASLPLLREFGLRVSGAELSSEKLEVLLRTKLQRLLLVDIAPDSDIAVVGDLPSLQELTVVGPIGDRDLENLTELDNLRRFVLRNSKASDAGVNALRKSLPECTIDWRLNQRWFDTSFAFDYVPGAT